MTGVHTVYPPAPGPRAGRQCPDSASRAFLLVAEADGNRTRQRRGTPLSGFEDQPPSETTLQAGGPEGSFAQVT
jgi:hypothetical protein